MMTRHLVPASVLILIVVLVSMSIWIILQSYQSSPLEAINPEYERFIRVADDGKRAQALKLGDSLFKGLFEQRPENLALALLAQRLRVAEQISTLATSGVRPSQQKLLEGIPGMEYLGLSPPVHEDKATRTSLQLPALGLYWTHLSAFTGGLALDDLSVQQAAFLGRYYDLQMQNSIMKVGRQIIMADPNSSENSCYALVLPLLYLYGRDNAWDQIESLLAFFSPNQLDVMWRFSLLQAERPQVSAWIAQYQAKMMGKDFTLALWALDAADVCVADHRPDLARLSLHIALDDTKNQSKVAELRLKIAESYARCGDYATAIQTCRQIADDLPNSTLYGRTMATYFGYLAKEANADQIVTETESALRDVRCKPYLPQILYLRWWALCKVDRRDEAVMVAQRLIERYSDNPCVAPVLLERATDALARQQYDRCHELLTKLTKDFPGTESAKRAEGILARFKGSGIQQGNGGFSASRTENRP
jgi:tetratricopeptide (TPR) repeat protein